MMQHKIRYEIKPETYVGHIIVDDAYKAESYLLWGELLHKTGKLELAVNIQ